MHKHEALQSTIAIVHEETSEHSKNFQSRIGEYARELEHNVNDALGQLQQECKTVAEATMKQMRAQKEVAAALGVTTRQITSLQANLENIEKRLRAREASESRRTEGVSKRFDSIESSITLAVENQKRVLAEAEAKHRSLFDKVRESFQA